MVTFIKKMILIQVFIIVSIMSYSQTYISSANRNNVISSGQTTWSDPWYIIEDNVTIQSGATLTIAPSASNILIEVDDGKYFNVAGSLDAAGTSTYSITFTKDPSGSGWSGIGFSSNSNPSDFNYCIFEYVDKSPATCAYNFASCGAVFINSSSNIAFEDCTFRYNTVCYGGGIAAISSEVQLTDCSFEENTASEYGGGIFISSVSSGSYIDNCSWIENAADYGGGIYAYNCNNNFSIYDNEFNLNEAIDGAGIYLTNITSSGYELLYDNSFSDNVASGNGGGAYITGSAIDEITGLVFSSNEANDGAGAYIDDSDIDNFENNDFEGNEAGNDGGGIVINESTITFSLCKLNTNTADNNGAGVFIEGSYSGGGSIDLINCEVADNVADNNGGGVYTDNSFYSYSNTIASNEATTGAGGGIYQNGCSSTIINTIIWGNTANSNANAYPTPDETTGEYTYCCTNPITQSTPSTCVITNPQFNGSGDYMLSKSSPCRDIGNNSIQHETYDLLGHDRIVNTTIDIGAFEHPYLYTCGITPISSNTTWTNHNPNGADYIVDCNTTVQSTYTLTINPGVEIAFDEDIYLDIDGALSAVGNSSNYIVFTATDENDGWGGVTFDNSSAGTSSISYCILEYGKKTYTPACGCGVFTSPYNGGAIYIKDFEDISISNSIFRYNKAERGGAIYVYSSTSTVIQPTISSSNSFLYDSACKGGAICLQTDGDEPSANYTVKATINGNYFYNNYADYYGGAIFADIYDNSEITNNTFGYNRNDLSCASARGGAICICGGSTTLIEKNTINNNYSIYGGGICINNGMHYQGSNPQILLNTISENEADYGGGIAFVNPGEYSTNNIQVEGNLIIENEAGDDTLGEGGGIYIQDFDPYIVNNTIADNIADTGAGVYADPNSTPTITNTIIYFNDDWSSNNEDIGGNLPTDNTSGFYTNCDIRNLTNAFPSINSNPYFSGSTYHPRFSMSDCKDNGDNGASLVTSTDMDGVTWGSVGSVIDIGCYEVTSTYYIVFNSLDENEDTKPLEDDSKEIEFNLYPNPTNASFTLSHSGSLDYFGLSIVDITGKVCLKMDLTGQNGQIPIDASSLLTGIYFVNIFNANKSLNKTLKLIKQ
jgi:predicted outer membrane repeat protein